jgi:hypothetical protein
MKYRNNEEGKWGKYHVEGEANEQLQWFQTSDEEKPGRDENHGQMRCVCWSKTHGRKESYDLVCGRSFYARQHISTIHY